MIVIGSGSHHNTLGVIRACGEYGIPIRLISIGKGFVLSSKYISDVCVIEDVNNLSNVLLDKGNYKSNKREVIISCADAVTEHLNINLDILSPYYIIPGCKKAGDILAFMDKIKMLEIAKEVGFEVPETYYSPCNYDNIPLPCIAKPVISSQGSKSDIRIIKNRIELEDYIDNTNEQIFLQKFIEKKDEIQFIGCSINGGYPIIIPGMTRVIRSQHNTNTGFLEFGPCDQYEYIIPRIYQLIRRCEYSGLFSVEFIRDNNNCLYFLEVNFRNDGNAYCVAAAGINLPAIWMKANLGEDYSKELSLLPLKKAIKVMPEMQDLKLVLQRKLSFLQWLKDVCNTDCYLLYNKYDIKPFLQFIKDKLYG